MLSKEVDELTGMTVTIGELEKQNRFFVTFAQAGSARGTASAV